MRIHKILLLGITTRTFWAVCTQEPKNVRKTLCFQHSKRPEISSRNFILNQENDEIQTSGHFNCKDQSTAKKYTFPMVNLQWFLQKTITLVEF